MNQARTATATLPRGVEPAALEGLVAAAISQKPVSLGRRRTDSPHEFYRYPARFSPDFAKAAILAFTEPGDLVLDPFVGGGTTLVEAMRNNRLAVGADMNELATFVSRVKTTVLNEVDLALLGQWSNRLSDRLDLDRPIPPLDGWRERGYLKDIDGAATAGIRSLIALAIESAGELPQEPQQDFARCVVLRTAQWALDMRTEVPSDSEFSNAMVNHALSMVAAARLFTDEMGEGFIRPIVVDQRLPGLAARIENWDPPRLILTSPPYPGVYVIYHRWKLMGRREIPAAYWIANRNDGLGMSAYTMNAKSGPTFDGYFDNLRAAYSDLRELAGPETLVVQMVGFNNLESQFDRYLETMAECGFEEVLAPELATAEDGRLWRSVPGRRWWNTTTSLVEAAPQTAKEVVLVHKVVPNS